MNAPVLVGHPTRAETTAPSPSLTPLVALLRAVLEKTGGIVVQPMPEECVGDYLGLTYFPGRLMYINPHQDDVEWLTTLVHELHHLLDGPTDVGLKDAAELKVQAATADTLAAMGVAR